MTRDSALGSVGIVCPTVLALAGLRAASAAALCHGVFVERRVPFTILSLLTMIVVVPCLCPLR